MKHRSHKILVFPRHPEAICGQDTREFVLVLDGKVRGAVSPCVALYLTLRLMILRNGLLNVDGDGVQ